MKEKNKVPKVSVIIPVYKVEKTLNRCVESIRSQSLDDIEIILVDDGSPDRCPDICDEYARKDNRIKVIHKRNEGLGYARNSGLDIATGEYVGFVDSDDYVKSNMYEELYTAAIKNSADAVFGGICYVNDTGKSFSHFELETMVFRGENEIKHFLMNRLASEPSECDDSRYGSTVTNGIFLNRILQEQHVRFVSERDYISEDTIFGLSFFSVANSVVMLPEHYYFYEYNPSSLTSSYRKDRFDKNKVLYKYVSEFIMKRYNDSNMVMMYGRAFIAAARVCAIQEAVNGDRVKGIRRISNDDVLKDVLHTYPWRKLPIKKRIFSFCTVYHLDFLLYAIIICQRRLMKK